MQISQKTAEKIHSELVKANQLAIEGKLQAARDTCLSVYDLCPEYPDTNQILGLIYFQEHQFNKAVEHLKVAVHDFPEQPFVWLRLGQAWLELRNADKARKAFETAISYAPEMAEAHYWLGHNWLSRGDTAKANLHLTKAISLDPGLGQAYRLLSKTVNEKEAIELGKALETRILSGDPIPEEERIHMLFALGRCLEKTGQESFAFDVYGAAKAAQKQRAPKWQTAFAQLVAETKEVFTKEVLARVTKKPTGVPIPIFIIGVPRSGSTLVEQILASHTKVFGADEVRFMEGVIASLAKLVPHKSYPMNVSELDETVLQDLSQEYLSYLQEISHACPYVTDKLLPNFHILGLIKMILPWAKIIHIKRNPYDTALSIHRNYFSESAAPYLSSLTDTGVYYLHYQDLINFWEQVLPKFIYTVEYEKLIASPKVEIQKLLDFCELKKEKACLEFFKTKRAVYSLSNTQVKTPLYATSIGTAKQFESRMTPFREALENKAQTTVPEKIKVQIKQAAHYITDSNYMRAKKICNQVLDKIPNQPDALQLLGLIYAHNQRHDQAIDFLQHSLNMVPDQPSVWIRLGVTLNQVRQISEAKHAFQIALYYNPQYGEAYLWLGMGALSQGDSEAAQKYLLKAIELEPKDGQPYSLLAKIEAFNPDQKFMEKLEFAAGPKARSPVDAAFAHYALAAIYKRKKNKDKFLLHIKTANQIQNATAPAFDTQNQTLEALNKKEFYPAMLQQAADPSFMKTTPIFIVGLPRSGSTLVEQILGRHHEVFAGDELLFMHSHLIPTLVEMTKQPYPEGLSKLKSKDWEVVGEAYLERVSQISGNMAFVTDKLLTNIFYLGLIRLALPKSKVIFVRRNLMDTALSIYSNFFLEQMSYCCNLKKLGQHAKRIYSMVDFWKALAPGFIYDLQYEDLVQNQEEESRRLLKFCGLKWDSDCLDFHKSTHQVFTHSTTQVRQPIYVSSIGKWKEYAELLQPFMDEIGDFVDKDGFLKS